MTVKPMVFNTEMVEAILNGQKITMRRAIKPQPKMPLCWCSTTEQRTKKWRYPPEGGYDDNDDPLTDEDMALTWVPPCHEGDILWVRETWGCVENSADSAKSYYYKADRPGTTADQTPNVKWCTAMAMPKEAARIFLKVTEVSIRRLHDMDVPDMVAEGILDLGAADTAIERQFIKYWDRLYRDAEECNIYGWDANPWVWVVSFKQCERPKEADEPAAESKSALPEPGIGMGPCFYNHGVECNGRRDCENCGWSPKVQYIRKQMIQRRSAHSGSQKRTAQQ